MSYFIRSYNNCQIRIREDRYTCLTDMAKATGKRFPDWYRLDSSKSYIETLSSVVQIPTTELIQVTQGGIPENQGTWGHPKVAIRFAQWCSDEFAVQVDCWIDELLTTGKVALNNSQLDNIDFVNRAIDCIFSDIPIKKELVAGIKLNAIQKLNPLLAPTIEDSRQLLINNTATEHELTTPTKIGAKLGKSARWVNQRLIELGYQYKNPKQSSKDPTYLPTTTGKEFCSITLATDDKSNRTFQQLRWYDVVVDVLR